MLMGAYIFLGSEALIPQLTANVSAVGSAVTMIRSRSILVNHGWIKTVPGDSPEIVSQSPQSKKYPFS